MPNKYGLSRTISPKVKKLVREKCRFGCVVCGRVPYHYDHFRTAFKDAKEHDPEDIILLCTTHHDLKTKELLDNDDISHAWRQRQNAPGEFAFHLPITKPSFRVRWPANDLKAGKHQIVVDDKPVLELRVVEDPLQPVVMSGAFCDFMGRELCRIENNEIVSASNNIGDFQLVQNRFLYKRPGGTPALYSSSPRRG